MFSCERTDASFLKVMRVKIASLWSFFFKIVCVIGFVFQVFEVLQSYFRYETTSKMSMGVDDELPVPSLAVCFRWTDILDRSQYEKYNLSKVRPVGLAGVTREENLLKVGQIFHLTPKANETIKQCKYREHDSYDFIPVNGIKCYEHFQVKKFLMQTLMCYTIVPKKINIYRMTRVAQAINYIGLVWEVFLDTKLDVADDITAIIYFEIRNSLPLYSRNYGTTTRRYSDPLKYILSYNVFYISHEWHRIFLKPPPYDTNCDEGEGRFSCMRSCLKGRLLSVNRVPFTEITLQEEVDEIGHLFSVTSNDLRNPKIKKCLYESESVCEKKCKQLPCFQFFTKTSMTTSYERRYNLTARVRATSPHLPTTDVITIPTSSLGHLIIYICTCFGTWFGLSVLSLDPAIKSVVYKLKEKKSSKTPLRRQTLAKHNMIEVHTSLS